jgi:hypothetical protein
MRWQQLFADLAAQFEEAEAAAGRPETAARARAEFGSVRLADRLAGSAGTVVVLRCRGAGSVRGVLTEVGVDWLLLDDDRGGELLIAAGAVCAVTGLGRLTATAPEEGSLRTRLDLRWAVRAMARDRSAVQVVLADGTALSGTVDRVGADFFELAEHAVDEPRRAAAVQGVSAVALAAVAVVRTAGQRPG